MICDLFVFSLCYFMRKMYGGNFIPRSQFQQHANQHYEQAAEYFNGEELPSKANKCLLKAAQIATHLEDYEKAITIFEEVRKFIPSF